MDTFDPSRPDFTPFGLTCVRWRPALMHRTNHHNEVELNFLYSGSLDYLIGGKPVSVPAGQLVGFWAAIPHQVVGFAPGTEYFVATIPFSWILQWQLPEPLQRRLMRGDAIFEPDTCRNPDFDYALFSRWTEDLKAAPEGRRDIVLLEMQARLRRLGLAAERVPARALASLEASESRDPLNKVEKMVCLIAHRYTEPLTVEDISESVSLHPNYAMKLFKQTFGTTLVHYLTLNRVTHAQRLLVSTTEKVVEVARCSGFNSLSRFNEAFRRLSDCTPSQYRQRYAVTEAE